MNLRAMFGNVSIGKDTSGNYKLWTGGVAVRTSGSEYVGFERPAGLRDVTCDVITELDFIYKVPVKEDDLVDGDLILVKDGATPDVLFVAKPPIQIPELPLARFLNPRTFRSEHYHAPRDEDNEPIYIRIFSPLAGLLKGNPLLQLMLVGGHDSHALAALLYRDLNDDKRLKDLTAVFVSEKGLSSELLSLKKLQREVKSPPCSSCKCSPCKCHTAPSTSDSSAAPARTEPGSGGAGGGTGAPSNSGTAAGTGAPGSPPAARPQTPLDCS